MAHLLPISRHLLLLSSVCVVILTLFLFCYHHIITATAIDRFFLSQIQHGTPVQFIEVSNHHDDGSRRHHRSPASHHHGNDNIAIDPNVFIDLSTTFGNIAGQEGTGRSRVSSTTNHPRNTQNVDVALELFIKCPIPANPITNAIRLPYPILNISMHSAYVGSSVEQMEQRYFNPTLIPLPPRSSSSSSSRYQYLLLSRLVTGGLHQETHVCFAVWCDNEDDDDNSRGEGMEREGVCRGVHGETDDDESGSDNSGGAQRNRSASGLRCATMPQRLNIPPTPALRCVGAWSAFPDIPGFHDPRVFWSGKGEPLVIVNSGSQYACVGLWVVDLRVVYPELRDMLERKGSYAATDTEMAMVLSLPAPMSYPQLTEITREPRSARGDVEKNWMLFFPRAEESWVQYDLVGHGKKKQTLGKFQGFIEDNADKVRVFHNVTLTDQKTESNSSNHSRSESLESAFDNFTRSAIYPLLNHSEESQDTNSRNTYLLARSGPQDQPHLMPSRSLAKIIGSGYTTANLTSLDETPCLSSDNLFDSTGNQGHWHQGSNSLRLILCTHRDNDCLLTHDDNELVKAGKVVHFAILHRKFSNELDLPMRYERYIMMWEARYPFRMIGINKHPILFKGERAQPWSNTENGLEGNAEAKRLEGVYFTYTPSLTWAWKKHKPVADQDRRHEAGLGTGYLGDEVMIGIGMDDVAQGIVKIKVEELLGCLRLCPDFSNATQT